MAFFGLFKKNEKDLEVLLKKREKNPLQNAAVAAAFAEAGEHATARSMIERPKGNRKILVIGRESSFSPRLVEYALEMAKRLDFEILALNVTEAPLRMAQEKREEATEFFRKDCVCNVACMMEQAQNAGIEFSHLLEIGLQDEVVEKLHAEYPGMRYVLTEPDQEVADMVKGNVSIPVFDLGSYHGLTA
ncbi:MAG: hypothetical protein V1706_09070 [Pseudomonadota bacterium]